MNTSMCEFTSNEDNPAHVMSLLLWTAYGSRVAPWAWGDGGFGHFSMGHVVSSPDRGWQGARRFGVLCTVLAPCGLTHVVARGVATCLLVSCAVVVGYLPSTKGGEATVDGGRLFVRYG